MRAAPDRVRFRFCCGPRALVSGVAKEAPFWTHSVPYVKNRNARVVWGSELLLTPRARMNTMISAPARFFALVLAVCLSSAAAEAQLFGRSDDRSQQGGDAGDLSVRLDRIENQMRQLTGTLEQMQYQNQQLQEQLRAMQQQVDSGGAPRSAPRPPLGAGQGPAPVQPAPVYQPHPDQPPAAGGRRGDAFDPNAQPGAPGSPRQLGTMQGQPEQPGQAPMIYGRAPGQPMDIGSYSGKGGN